MSIFILLTCVMVVQTAQPADGGLGVASSAGIVGYPFTWKCRIQSVEHLPTKLIDNSPSITASPQPLPLPPTPTSTVWTYGKSIVKSNGTGWSNEGNFTVADAKAANALYPNSDLPSW